MSLVVVVVVVAAAPAVAAVAAPIPLVACSTGAGVVPDVVGDAGAAGASGFYLPSWPFIFSFVFQGIVIGIIHCTIGKAG